MSEVKMGVLGCGSIADIAHFPSITKTKGMVLQAVCDSDEGRAKAAKDKWHAKEYYLDYKEMFANANLDGVVIATPNNLHRNQAIAAARAGVHVIVEKPMAITNEEAWDIVNTCKEAGVKLMVGCDRRFWTHNQWAKQLIEDGIIGNLLFSRASLHEHWYNYQNHVAYTDFRLRCDVAGGAAICDTGAHAIDLLTWLNGSKVKRCIGIAQRIAMPETYTKCDDLATLMLEFENGAQGFVSCNRFSPAISQSTDLWGTEGTIHTATDATNPFQSCPMAVFTNKDYSKEDLPELLENYRWPELFWVEDKIENPVRKRWIPICPPRHPSNYERMTAHFLDCIVNDKEPLVSGEDGARTIEVICAVFKSMETNSWVDLPLKEEIIPPYYNKLERE
ncbi:MAG: Gfo/Idh/MocA family oxidoreductase [Candidatus Marinimicrobia bacterium]|nr:Gfo/Idh/MocA family oxidoreductase [Candidatus Neomarinimicrobiota bacterium]